jgi:2-polyprenyl-6-hydroxyphenyl methylase/3-demethylubiquinone-9 3-methyltransferase
MSTRANVDPAEVAKFEALAQRWWDPHGEFRPLHDLNPLRLAFVAERAALSGSTALDAGCGGGILSEALARQGARVLGIDVAGAALEVARLHAQETGVAVEYRLIGAEDLARERPAAFDVVTCMEMLEHVPEPEESLAALAQLTRPGGQLFLSTINRTLKAFAFAIVGAEYVMRLLPRGTHEYERFIRPSELAAWGRKAGLELRQVAGIRFDPFTRRCSLTEDASVNYLVHFTRPAAG